jgi:mannosyltransferase OCH1-like enzyme
MPATGRRDRLVRNFIVLLVSRVIKLAANLIKAACYLFHFFFPNQRYTLPSQAAPLWRSRRPTRIPRTLWQTNYTQRVTLAVYINYLFNRLLSPTFEYRFMVTEARAEFIQARYAADVFDDYSRLQIGAAQADFWRLLVLQQHGGVYLDIDAHFVWPLGRIVKPDYDELYIKIKRGELSNYFIASKPDNPHLAQMIQLIQKNIRENTLKNVYDLTGPGVLNQVLDVAKVNTTYYRYTCSQGNFTNEFFQYIDKPQGKWTKAQKEIDIVKK